MEPVETRRCIYRSTIAWLCAGAFQTACGGPTMPSAVSANIPIVAGNYRAAIFRGKVSSDLSAVAICASASRRGKIVRKVRSESKTAKNFLA